MLISGHIEENDFIEIKLTNAAWSTITAYYCVLASWSNYILVKVDYFLLTCSSSCFRFSSSSFCFLNFSVSCRASVIPVKKLSMQLKNSSGWTCFGSSQNAFSVISYCQKTWNKIELLLDCFTLDINIHCGWKIVPYLKLLTAV